MYGESLCFAVPEHGGMEFMHAVVRISARRESEAHEIRLLVDTGAFYSIVPRAVLTDLGVEPSFRSRLRLADGTVIERAVGDVYLQYPGRPPIATMVVFGEEADEPVLGIHTLEGLGLQIDPRSGTIREMDSVPLIAVAPA